MAASIRGITRVPYFPELELLNEEHCEALPLTLSSLLYWSSLENAPRFNTRQHLVQLARNLRRDPNDIEAALELLCAKKILIKDICPFETCSEDPQKKIKYDIFYSLDFHRLGEMLKERGLNVPQKVLRAAADDTFDIRSYISPSRLPLVTGLKGFIRAKDYECAAVHCAKILCGICAEEDLEAFSYKALAPGWRMLVQPPAQANDIAARWMRQGERSIDVDLTDGSFFLPDADCFGTADHHLWHCLKNKEPRVLAAALYLAVQACSNGNMHFYSELSVKELTPAFLLVKRLCGLVPTLDEVYFDNLEITGESLAEEKNSYRLLIDTISETK